MGMNAVLDRRRVLAPLPVSGTAQLSSAAGLILSLLALRWGAGIAENFGFSNISELAAILMLAGLGLVFVMQFRLAADSWLLVAGLLSWAFVGALSLLANDVPAPVKSLTLLALLALYALFANGCVLHLRTPAALRCVTLFAAAFIGLGALLSFYQIATGNGFVEPGNISIQRAFGSDVHPVSFAIQLVGALTLLEIGRTRLGRRISLIYGILFMMGGIALYLTFARTGWIMAMIVVGFGYLSQRSLPVKTFFLAVSVPLIVGLTISSGRFSDLGSLATFWANFSFDNLVFDYRYIDNSMSWRIVNWGYGLQQAFEQPILGFGPGQSASSSYFELEMHNLLLESFYEGGIFGAVACILTLGGLARMHMRLPRGTRTDRHARALANGFGLSLFLAVMLSTSFVDQLMSFLIYILVLVMAAGSNMRGSAHLLIRQPHPG